MEDIMRRTLRQLFVLVGVSGLVLIAPAIAAAQCCGCAGSCTANGQSHFCDILCFDETCSSAANFTNCDSNCTDGKCVLCNADNGVNDPVTITGSSGVDVICVRSGNTGSGKEIYRGGGGNDILAVRLNDTLYGGDDLDGGSGADLVFGGDADDLIDNYSGADVIRAGNGNDTFDGSSSGETFYGEGGDDFIDGKSGDDILDGGTGRSVIYGGSGDDTISTSAGSTHDVLGSVLCGGTYHDTITASGFGHVCIDAGTGTDSCAYTQPSAACVGDNHDVATMSGCESLSGSPPFDDVPCPCP
jgi:Ca2+-binding RTX toxin-like protein